VSSEPTEYTAPHPVPLVGGTVTAGLWCDTCLLPNRYEAPIYALTVDGPVQIGTVSQCSEGHQP
jgi:hypothetical protein